MLRFLGLCFLCLASASPTLAMGTPVPTPNSLWHPHHFDGKEFIPGPTGDGLTAYLRDGYLPIVLKNGDAVKEARLPDNSGAVAGILFLQTAGGKLRDLSGYLPLPEFTVEFVGSTVRQAAKTDANGFFVVALPSGEYELRAAGMVRTLRVEPGKTSLHAIRAGKRMGD